MGVPIIITAPRFNLDNFCEAIQKYRITFCNVVPPIALALSKSDAAERYDLSSLKWLTSGAAPCPREIFHALQRRMGIQLKQAYGMTESSPIVTMQTNEQAQTKRFTVGCLVPNVECKIVDFDGNLVPIGTEGELWFKGPNIMMGYLNNPEASKASLTEDGFYRTGDVGFADEDGFISVTDRLKELIKYKGRAWFGSETNA